MFAKIKEKKDSSYAINESNPQKDQNVLEAYQLFSQAIIYDPSKCQTNLI